MAWEDLPLNELKVAHYFKPDHVDIYRLSFGDNPLSVDGFVRICKYDMLPEEVQVKLAWLNAKNNISTKYDEAEAFKDIGYMWSSDDYHREYVVFVNDIVIQDLHRSDP